MRGKKALRRRRLVALGALVLIVLVGAGVTLAATSDDGAAPAKVSLDGVDVSGKGAADVQRAARARARELMKVPLVITRTDDPQSSIQVSRAELGARPQIRRAVQEVLEPRSFGGRVVSLLGLVPTRDVHIAFTLDPRKVSALVARVRRPGDTPATPASLEVRDDDIVVVPGSAGFGIDPVALRARIAELPEQIALTPEAIAPPVSDAAAAAGPHAGAGDRGAPGLGHLPGPRGRDRGLGPALGAALPPGPARPARRPRPGHALPRHRLGLQHPRAARARRHLRRLRLVGAAGAVAHRPQPRHAGHRGGDRRPPRRPPRCARASP